MSANNWSICPKCKAAEVARLDAAIRSSASSYGKVTVDEYEQLKSEAKPVELQETMREDYELGVGENGRFEIHYAAQCTKGGCGFRYRFDYRAEAMSRKKEPTP